MYIAREGRLVQITKDQNLLQRARDTGATILSSADLSRYKSTLLQVIGRSSIDEVVVHRIELRRGDVLLLCTDGITNELCDEDINLVLSTEPRLDTASSCLVSLANARGGRDNMTVVVAGVSGSGVPEPPPSEPPTMQFS
jgi:serine/threonine protein phosphatase PrpC